MIHPVLSWKTRRIGQLLNDDGSGSRGEIHGVEGHGTKVAAGLPRPVCLMIKDSKQPMILGSSLKMCPSSTRRCIDSLICKKVLLGKFDSFEYLALLEPHLQASFNDLLSVTYVDYNSLIIWKTSTFILTTLKTKGQNNYVIHLKLLV
ncbi:hypothetical protein XENORESO_012004 [Xenotaenia resolanae]|uniref:Uncharacterized protein n=1 Tax=Xenotaenia resolanae TaxID=208358 RepID=A0ABV0VMJ8_9TELE